jgi:hypothetical protein
METGYGYVNFHHLRRASCAPKLVEIGDFQILSLHIRIGLKARIRTCITKWFLFRISSFFLDIHLTWSSPTKLNLYAVFHTEFLLHRK